MKKDVKEEEMEKGILQELNHLIDVFIKVKKAIEDKASIKLKNLSNQTIHSASIYQQPDFIGIAIIIYGLSKIIEREKYRTYKEWPEFYSNVLSYVESIISDLKRKNIPAFRHNLLDIKNLIEKLTGKLGIYIREVFRRASINKASRIYEHGISLAKTAELLGITEFELAEYVGKTGIADVNLSITKDIKQRIKTAENLFK